MQGRWFLLISCDIMIVDWDGLCYIYDVLACVSSPFMFVFVCYTGADIDADAC